MNDLDCTLFYRVTFDMALAPGAEPGLPRALVAFMRKYLYDSWAGSELELPQDDRAWEALATGGHFSCAAAAGSVRMEAALLRRGEGALQWACRVAESRPARGVARRTWYTELCLDQRADDNAVLTVLVSYGDLASFMGPVADAPEPCVPAVVERLVRDGHLALTNAGTPPCLGPCQLGSADFPAFWSFVSDPSRAVPVVFVSPRMGEGSAPAYLVDPAVLDAMLGPAAFVYHTRSHGFMDSMSHALGGKGLGCWGGAVRVYQPHPRFGKDDDVRRHHFFNARNIEELGQERVALAIRRTLVQDGGRQPVPMRVEGIRERLRASGVRRRASQEVRQGEEDALRWAEDIQGEMDLLRAENVELRQSNHALRSTLASLRRANERPAWSPVPGVALGGWPLTPQQVGQLFVTCYSTRLDFTDRGWRSLESCHTSPEVVWNALFDLCVIAWELFAGDDGVDVQRVFNEQSTFSYAHGIGPMTRRDARMAREYQDTYQGRDISCETHIGRGSDDNDPGSVRVYFYYDAPSGKVVVSHCGAHLSTFVGRGRA